MGLYRRRDSKYWWMTVVVDGKQQFVSTRTRSKSVARQILCQREAEIALGLFKVGWPGERITFDKLCDEFEKAHFAGLKENTVKGHQTYIKQLKSVFSFRALTSISTQDVESYRDARKQQPSKRRKTQLVKGATVNRELECLKCILDLAVRRRYIPENPAVGVKHFQEIHERPEKQMVSAETIEKILNAAAPHLRVGIILLIETGGRTYSECFSLRWDQIDLEQGILRQGNNVKTRASSKPIPLTSRACEELREWKKQSSSGSPYVFPSPDDPGKPIRSVKTAWANALERAGVDHFPIYRLRHVYCTNVSRVASDATVQQAMRHSSPETKLHYQLGSIEDVRQASEKASEAYWSRKRVLRFYDVRESAGKNAERAACK